LLKFRQDHPQLPVIATLDALYANAPVIRDLRKALMAKASLQLRNFKTRRLVNNPT
jgi:hypothetical protein